MRLRHSQEAIAQTISQYAVGTASLCKELDSGLENSNCYVETDQGTYVLKIFEGPGMTAETIEFEVTVMRACSDAGLKVPRVHANKSGSYTTPIGTTLAILIDFVEGTNNAERSISDEIAGELGEQMGKMDALLSKLTDIHTRKEHEFDAKNVLMLERVMAVLPSDFDKKIFENSFQAVKEIKPRYDTLPSGVIHNDLVLHNFFEKDGHLTGIIDFSDIAYSPYVQNVASAFCATFFTFGNWKPAQAGVFLAEYRKYHPLSEQELEFLYEATLMRFLTIILGNLSWDPKYGPDPARTRYIRRRYEGLQQFIELGRLNFYKALGLA